MPLIHGIIPFVRTCGLALCQCNSSFVPVFVVSRSTHAHQHLWIRHRETTDHRQTGSLVLSRHVIAVNQLPVTHGRRSTSRRPAPLRRRRCQSLRTLPSPPSVGRLLAGFSSAFDLRPPPHRHHLTSRHCPTGLHHKQSLHPNQRSRPLRPSPGSRLSLR